MPRRRTIACTHCGHLVRKRDRECELCFSLTRRAKVSIATKTAGVLVTLMGIGFVIYRLQSFTAGLAP